MTLSLIYFLSPFLLPMIIALIASRLKLEPRVGAALLAIPFAGVVLGTEVSFVETLMGPPLLEAFGNDIFAGFLGTLGITIGFAPLLLFRVPSLGFAVVTSALVGVITYGGAAWMVQNIEPAFPNARLGLGFLQLLIWPPSILWHAFICGTVAQRTQAAQGSETVSNGMVPPH